jgi:sulfur carrier protein
MQITLNGEISTTDERSIRGLLRSRQMPERGVAVAVNGEIVRRSDWDIDSIIENAIIEVVTAAAGG